MSTILKNILAFSNLQIGVPVSLPHGLNLSDLALTPQLVAADAAGFTLSADATSVTATRTAAAASGDVHVYVEHWHTIEEVLPLPGKLAGLTPFIFAAGGGSAAPQSANARVRETGVAYCTVGCTTSRTGEGRYHVDFSPAFPDNVSVVATICENLAVEATAYQLFAYNITPTGFDLSIDANFDGWGPEDAEWSFIANASISDI